MRIISILSILLASVVAASCSSAAPSSDDAIVAAFYPLAFAAGTIAGPDADVVDVVPPGVEPHDLELAPRDVDTIQNAERVLYVGSGFQPALEQALEGSDTPATDVLKFAGVDPVPFERHREGQLDAGSHVEDADSGDIVDPHVWLDPVRFSRLVEGLGEVLEQDGHAGASRRAGTLGKRLANLDAEYSNGLATCRRRELYTNHDAFGYIAERYDLDVFPITGISPEAEPQPRDLARLAKQARSHGATTIFFETLVSPSVAATLAREAGAKTAVLNPLEGLTQDQLDDGEDYFTVMRDNLDALRAGLGCT